MEVCSSVFIVDRHTWGGGVGIVGGLSSETVVVLVVMVVIVVVVVLGVTPICRYKGVQCEQWWIL